MAWPGPLSHAPECECGCGRTVDGDYMIRRGAIYRGDCFLLLENPPRCLFCGAKIASGNFCDPRCYDEWERRGLEDEELDHEYRLKIGD